MKNKHTKCRPNALIFVITLVFILPLFARCATTSYVRPEEVTEVDETLTDTDLRLMAEKMVQSLAELAVTRHREAPPKIAILGIGNRTSQHVDTEAIAEKIMVHALKTRTVRFVDRELLKEMAKEQELVGTQSIDVDDAVMLGQLAGADYFLSGDIMSIEKRKGTKYIAYYKLTLRLVDVNTSEIVWADEKEIKKISQKGFLDW